MILLTGASGKLGREIAKVLPGALAPKHESLDIVDAARVRSYVRANSISTIIHCAAVTNIRFCESNRQVAMSSNVEGTRNLLQALWKNHDAYFVYISTACVFPGDDLEHFYSESDLPYPKNYYGLTKLLGEYVCKEFDVKTLIVRTNFVERSKWMYPSAFTDRFGTYLYADQVASAIVRLVQKSRTGIVHVCGDKRMSMYDLAYLLDHDVKPMTLRDYRGPPVTVNMSLKSNYETPIHFDAPMP
jgi:dTDP-4-dehydrorhamnose reductase